MDTGTIEITAEFPWLGFFYALLTPNIELDGRLEKRPWGTHRFEVPPGHHVVEVSYPWMFSPRAGKSSVEVQVAAGQTVRVRYKARLVRYMPGAMSVEGPLPEARIVR